MTPIDKTSGPHSSSRRSAQLRMIGIVVLVLGLGSAGVVYWLGTRSPDVMDDISMLGYNSVEQVLALDARHALSIKFCNRSILYSPQRKCRWRLRASS